MRWILGVVTAVVAVLVLATPVLAGGWATTLLDPLPDRLEAGHTYTVGFWILQHGSHVSQIGLNNPGLKLVDDKGQTLAYKGVALPEGGHYATALILPHDGDWAIFGMQAPFQDYEVGVLRVPGRVVVGPTPQPLAFKPDPSWSTVKPPTVIGEAVPSPKAAPATRSLRGAVSSPTTPWAPLGVGVFLGLAAATLGSAASKTTFGRLMIGRLVRTWPILRTPLKARTRQG
jgi:hypothetical protein